MRLLAYFPLFGWFFPMFFTRSEEARFHARQGFGLFLQFALVMGIAWFFTNGIPLFLYFLEVFLLIAPCVAYLGLLGTGMVRVLAGRQEPLPFVGGWSARLRV
jgi:uncharacterized membrane protein